MAARRPVPTTTLQILTPAVPARRPARRIEPREVIDRTVRADNRLLLTVDEAAERLGIGRSLMYELISSGQVTSIRVGRLRRITPEALSAYVAALHGCGDDGPGPAVPPMSPILTPDRTGSVLVRESTQRSW